ncbi:ABC transporter ATP-binding protein [Acholeplasma granularum]|uniref:ABC transporter ATP-binding protein n=1 Tax=Acholeplasma granularum TaxID=264635 RepID=UPI00046E6076|nr:ATP-binding cassette domain-containing protein [Acholeplasma granularum]
MSDVILKVDNLKQHFKIGPKMVLKAVDGISFEVKKGEVFSLVGESGCGKTTTGRSLINLYEITDGNVYFKDQLISAGNQSNLEKIKSLKSLYKNEINKIKESDASEKEEKIAALKLERNEKIKAIRAEIRSGHKSNNNRDKDLMKKMQMIFQDPIASLNPRMTVKEIIAEGLRIDGEKDKDVITKKVNDALNRVGLLPEHANRYPHEFSGGQRQRIGIARALIVEPDFIIADEPISALDISIQAQVINLLNDLRDELGITILFIAHDLSVVKYFSDRVAVMYAGKIVEMGDKSEIFDNPLHPYTKSLLSAIPVPDPLYEKTKGKRLVYNPAVHDYSVDKPKMVQIKENHFIYANEQELEQYRKMI